MNLSPNSLYIHIPFCDKICPYCDFLKIFKNQSIEDLYIENILKDLEKFINLKYKFKTIYIGGGTPSCLSIDNLTKLLFSCSLILDTDYEFTIEGNPESLNEQKLEIFKKFHINRISIGIQSFNKRILNFIDRNYDVDIFRLINSAKRYISNINIDLIYGINDQTLDELKDDLNKFIVLDVPHISIYSLIIEPNTKFYLNKVREQDEDKSREFYDFIIDFLLNHSYEHYEISNFAKNGCYSKHNLTYWKNKEYIGIGAGASGYEKNIRYKNSSSISKYNNGIREREEEIITKDLLYEYYLITNLRLISGFSISEINQIFKFNFLRLKNEAIKKLLKSDLIKIEGDNFACTRDGLALQDIVIRTLI